MKKIILKAVVLELPCQQTTVQIENENFQFFVDCTEVANLIILKCPICSHTHNLELAEDL